MYYRTVKSPSNFTMKQHFITQNPMRDNHNGCFCATVSMTCLHRHHRPDLHILYKEARSFCLCKTYCSFTSYSVCLRVTSATYFGGHNNKQVRKCPQVVALLALFVCFCPWILNSCLFSTKTQTLYLECAFLRFMQHTASFLRILAKPLC
jgi:hypothetical protein